MRDGLRRVVGPPDYDATVQRFVGGERKHPLGDFVRGCELLRNGAVSARPLA
jgi:hypothetical protein